MEARRPSPTPEFDRRPEAERPSGALFKRVAVCVDGSEIADAIVHLAAEVAEAFSASLTILRVVEPYPGLDETPIDPLDWSLRQREAQADLDRMRQLAGPDRVAVESELLQGAAAEQICEWTRLHQIDLTVLGSHGERGRSEWSLASTARKLVDGVSGSVLLVPLDGIEADGLCRTYGRVVVPLDGSSSSESALPMATRFATAHDAELLLVHVPPGPVLTRVGPPTAEDLDLEARVVERNQRVAVAYLDQIRARLQESGVRVRVVVATAGDVRTRLARFARREDAGLVVLSAYGQRGPRDIPCGSVAGYLLTHATAPLLVVRERPRHVLRRYAAEAAKRAPHARPPAQVVS